MRRRRARTRSTVGAVAGERAAEVSIDVADELRPLLDDGAFERIVGNVVTNALGLTVEDHGDGVSPAFVPRLFERFTREMRPEGAKGSGLGLSIAQAYAHAHGGQLFYEDASPRGARFQLVLPAK